MNRNSITALVLACGLFVGSALTAQEPAEDGATESMPHSAEHEAIRDAHRAAMQQRMREIQQIEDPEERQRQMEELRAAMGAIAAQLATQEARSASREAALLELCSGLFDECVTAAEPQRAAAVLQAAVNGRGVALGRRAYSDADLASGHLIEPFDLHFPQETAFYVVTPEHRATEQAIAAFRDWILAEARDADVV